MEHPARPSGPEMVRGRRPARAGGRISRRQWPAPPIEEAGREALLPAPAQPEELLGVAHHRHRGHDELVEEDVGQEPSPVAPHPEVQGGEHPPPLIAVQETIHEQREGQHHGGVQADEPIEPEAGHDEAWHPQEGVGQVHGRDQQVGGGEEHGHGTGLPPGPDSAEALYHPPGPAGPLAGEVPEAHRYLGEGHGRWLEIHPGPLAQEPPRQHDVLPDGIGPSTRLPEGLGPVQAEGPLGHECPLVQALHALDRGDAEEVVPFLHPGPDVHPAVADQDRARHRHHVGRGTGLAGHQAPHRLGMKDGVGVEGDDQWRGHLGEGRVQGVALTRPLLPQVGEVEAEAPDGLLGNLSGAVGGGVVYQDDPDVAGIVLAGQVGERVGYPALLVVSREDDGDPEEGGGVGKGWLAIEEEAGDQEGDHPAGQAGEQHDARDGRRPADLAGEGHQPGLRYPGREPQPAGGHDLGDDQLGQHRYVAALPRRQVREGLGRSSRPRPLPSEGRKRGRLAPTGEGRAHTSLSARAASRLSPSYGRWSTRADSRSVHGTGGATTPASRASAARSWSAGARASRSTSWRARSSRRTAPWNTAPALVLLWERPTALRPSTVTSPGPRPAKQMSLDQGEGSRPPRWTWQGPWPRSVRAAAHRSPTHQNALPTSASHRGSPAGMARSTHTMEPGTTSTTPPPLARRTTSTPALATARLSRMEGSWVLPRTRAGRVGRHTHTLRDGPSIHGSRPWREAGDPSTRATSQPAAT